MIHDNYSASCFVEYANGEYRIESDIWTEDKEAYAEYTGDNFVEGINSILDELAEAMKEPEPEPEPKTKTFEEQNTYLNNLVLNLREQNARLANELKFYKSQQFNEINNDRLADLLETVIDDIYNSYRSYSD